jgi:hypothetical protein
MVQQQAAMLSYNDTFRFLALIFLLMLPLLFLMRKGEEGQSGNGTLTARLAGCGKTPHGKTILPQTCVLFRRRPGDAATPPEPGSSGRG